MGLTLPAYSTQFSKIIALISEALAKRFTDPAQREKFLKLVENVENREIKKADCLPMRNIRFGIHIIPPPVLRQAVHHLFCRLIKLVKYFPVFLVNSMVFHVGFN